MRLLQLNSQCGDAADRQPRPVTEPRPLTEPRPVSADDDTRHVEHIYESPDSVRRVPPRPGVDWRSGNILCEGGRYELPVNVHDQQRFTAVALTTAVANYSL